MPKDGDWFSETVNGVAVDGVQYPDLEVGYNKLTGLLEINSPPFRRYGAIPRDAVDDIVVTHDIEGLYNALGRILHAVR